MSLCSSVCDGGDESLSLSGQSVEEGLVNREAHGAVCEPHDKYPVARKGCWASLPLELLRDVIKRLEGSESKQPSRKHVVACASVCRAWRGMCKEIVRNREFCGNLTLPVSLKQGNETIKIPAKIGDRMTSDVIVRLRTDEGRDHWLYCHSEVLVNKSKYFAERLSDDWPTCQILDSRYCVEVYSQEPEFDSYVTALRLFYMPEPHVWHGVRNAIGILQVAIHLGCPQMAGACMEYLEAVPWEEAEEEEILRIIPKLGPQYERILARLQPVDQCAAVEIFISAIRFATSSPPAAMQELKSCTQEQLEYMLTEDEDAPLVSLENEVIKSEVRRCVKHLLDRFNSLVETLVDTSQSNISEENRAQHLRPLLCDISWTCQILSKMEMMKDLVHYWVDASVKIVNAAEQLHSYDDMLATQLKFVEVASKVLEAVGCGNVILPTTSRLHAVRVWLPFVQKMRPLVDQGNHEDGEEEVSSVRVDGDIWQGLESSLVSIIVTLPSGDQADILAGWLRCHHVRYPDLTEAFEVWCYRSKVARRRIAMGDDNISNAATL